MIWLLAPMIVAHAVALAEERRLREEWIKTLPVEEQARIRQADREELEHQRKLEIAKAGRARNFWGE